MYKVIGVDVKSEFAYEGQKLGQRSLSAKKRKRKNVILLNNYIFLYENLFHLRLNCVCL